MLTSSARCSILLILSRHSLIINRFQNVRIEFIFTAPIATRSLEETESLCVHGCRHSTSALVMTRHIMMQIMSNAKCSAYGMVLIEATCIGIIADDMMTSLLTLERKRCILGLLQKQSLNLESLHTAQQKVLVLDRQVRREHLLMKI